ncbi:hypothetical protein [Mucilaginibacter dorajii]|uniref:hypothetical protein n=1 Tax=Mucilaginibacter dorajii TaxID=692994 RepID=UPI002169A19A|nr:hypothetical protein [Mucilaginibacter dorajii]MCS3733730.1 hypothetical protein [Mucilaginibacter dorajii]
MPKQSNFKSNSKINQLANSFIAISNIAPQTSLPIISVLFCKQKTVEQPVQ